MKASLIGHTLKTNPPLSDAYNTSLIFSWSLRVSKYGLSIADDLLVCLEDVVAMERPRARCGWSWWPGEEGVSHCILDGSLKLGLKLGGVNSL